MERKVKVDWIPQEPVPIKIIAVDPLELFEGLFRNAVIHGELPAAKLGIPPPEPYRPSDDALASQG